MKEIKWPELEYKPAREYEDPCKACFFCKIITGNICSIVAKELTGVYCVDEKCIFKEKKTKVWVVLWSNDKLEGVFKSYSEPCISYDDEYKYYEITGKEKNNVLTGVNGVVKYKIIETEI